jgi:hypothetical protein
MPNSMWVTLLTANLHVPPEFSIRSYDETRLPVSAMTRSTVRGQNVVEMQANKWRNVTVCR